MKGKIAFVLGAAVGYVLGTRAGRQRYEQIKRGAQGVWNTEPVQKGVGLVKGAIDERADEVKTFIRRASADAFANFARQAAPKEQPRSAATGSTGSTKSAGSTRSAGSTASTSSDEATSSASEEGSRDSAKSTEADS